MSEPQAEAKGPEPEPAATAAPAGPASDGAGAAHTANVEPSDDAPTVISATAVRPARPEDAFASMLRGRRLAHYELIEPIGVGGMAAVIRARDTQLDRTVALKILPPEMAADPEIVRRFQQEARAAAKLDHANIARVFFCGEDQGLNFIAFEFVEGENIRAILDRCGRIPVPEAIRYVLQIASGLAHAADRGVVHRDIKPSNIIISSNGRAKLVDMGLARSLDPKSDNGLTHSGVTLGTFDYISPEQALEPREADVRSDIYSLGCTLYHMLTGQPPFPEGTAAKKLHQHQHVAPVDPRQLNPQIPDEVAAVLARMMAKDSQTRYQRPEHLVQHLLQLAQKLGSIPEISDGLHFVGGPLPSPPRMRPVLVGLAAAVILVGLIVLQSLAPWPGPVPQAPDHAPGPDGSAAQANQPPSSLHAVVGAPKAPGKTSPIPPPRSARYIVHNAKELAAALAHQDPSASVILANDIDLTEEEYSPEQGHVPGLRVQGTGRELIIEAQDATHHPTVRLTYDARGGKEALWAALTVDGVQVAVSSVRFEVNAKGAPNLKMAAIKLENRGHLKLDHCELVQINPPSGPSGQMSSIIVDVAGGDTTKQDLQCNNCYFLSQQEAGMSIPLAAGNRQEAVAVAGAAKVQIVNCAFGPHDALFHMTQRTKPWTELRLRHCTALLTDGVVFQVEDDIPCRLYVSYSLFSRPVKGTVPAAGNARLIQQGRSSFDSLSYDGLDNRYDNLSAFWLGPAMTAPAAESWDKFQHLAKDNESQVLMSSPWKDADPLELLKQNQPQLAFQLDVTRNELRQVNQPNHHMVGVETCSWGPVYATLPVLPDISGSLLAGKIVVDPSATPMDGIRGIFPKLEEALSKAKPGDTILVKCNGVLPVAPVKLEDPACRLTIQPYPQYRPILSLGRTADADASLFRLLDGQLELDDMEIVLQPSQSGFSSQTVVTMAGVGQCIFKNCVVTLNAEDVSLAVVALVAPSGVKMGSSPPPRGCPNVSFQSCFVRGKGDLVAIGASRPLDLEADNSIVALAGSFLTMKGNPNKDMPSGNVQMTLKSVTTYLAGHLILLATSRNLTDLLPVKVLSASHCLFTSANGKSLVHFEGNVRSESNVKNGFKWEDGTHNAYSNFDQVLDQESTGTEMALTPSDRFKWQDDTNDDFEWFSSKIITAWPGEDRLWAKVMPADFKVKPKFESRARGCGANINSIPRPSQQSETRAALPLDH